VIVLIDWQQADGTTPLIACLRGEHWDTAQLLLSSPRIDPNHFVPPHLPPLLECAKQGWMVALRLLIDMPSVDVNLQLVCACPSCLLLHTGISLVFDCPMITTAFRCIGDG
jgi:hypothetical protein